MEELPEKLHKDLPFLTNLYLTRFLTKKKNKCNYFINIDKKDSYIQSITYIISVINLHKNLMFIDNETTQKLTF